jgi:Family of unknown function (DUF5996)
MTDWPELSQERDGPTIAALHLFSQIAGKIGTAVVPWRNHSWHVALHVGARGLRSEPIHLDGQTLGLKLDLVDHQFKIGSSAGGVKSIALEPRSVASFHQEVMEALAALGIQLTIHGMPNELDPAIPFNEDREERTYDRNSAERLWRVLLSADRVLRLFRSSFLGKVSPVHFFWGSFDLAVTRFSGRPAPLHPGGIPNLPDSVTREAYSHEVSSAGFWPGGAGGGAPLFYSYAYPSPPGFAEARAEPPPAHWDTKLNEFVLAYDDVRISADPDAAVLAFLESTYASAADLAKWDRSALECATGQPRVPRPL